MRIWLLTAACLVALTVPANAQSRARFKIHDVQLGLPAGPFSSEQELQASSQWPAPERCRPPNTTC